MRKTELKELYKMMFVPGYRHGVANNARLSRHLAYDLINTDISPALKSETLLRFRRSMSSIMLWKKV